jgi:hypothetical protein
MRSRRIALILFAMLTLAATACSDTVVVDVADGVYTARVPTQDQLATDAAAGIPGTFGVLRDAGIDRIEVEIDGDEVALTAGGETVTRAVSDREHRRVSSAQSIFQSDFEVEVIHLGDDPLVLGPVTIDEPVLVPGDPEGAPVVVVKGFRTGGDEYDVTCEAGVPCLVLSALEPPTGRYRYLGGADPADTGPIPAIEFDGSSVMVELAAGDRIPMSQSRSTTAACGLSLTPVWEVPAAADLAMEDPVLVDSRCATAPGRDLLTIMERDAIPTLAPANMVRRGTQVPTTPQRDPVDRRTWCVPGPDCLLYGPEG